MSQLACQQRARQGLCLALGECLKKQKLTAQTDFCADEAHFVLENFNSPLVGVHTELNTIKSLINPLYIIFSGYL